MIVAVNNLLQEETQSPLLLPVISSKQVSEISHFLRMGQLDLIAPKGQDNNFLTLRIYSDGWYCEREKYSAKNRKKA